jgi:hypothetical protein
MPALASFAPKGQHYSNLYLEPEIPSKRQKKSAEKETKAQKEEDLKLNQDTLPSYMRTLPVV